METLKHILLSPLAPILRFFDPADSFSFISLFLAGAVALAFVLSMKLNERHSTLKGAVRAAFQSALWRHPSTRLDAKIFCLNSVLFSLALASFVISSEAWKSWTEVLLNAISALPLAPSAPSWATRIVATLVGIVALDFGYYAAHWLSHRSDILWRFHQMHHSAEVLTPLTGARDHPLETVFFTNVIGFCVGVSQALLQCFIGASEPYLLFETNLLLFIYFVTLQHLRHSQIWLPFCGPLGYILQSPAHHQIHHSTEPSDHGKNLGFSLSIFDALFGTLRLPKPSEDIRFGLSGEAAPQDVRDFYFAPFERRRVNNHAVMPDGVSPATVK